MFFIAKRLCVTFITMFLVSLFTFAAFTLIPGDPAALILGTEGTEEQLSAMRLEMGLDRSFAGRYASWLGGFLTGKLGNSSRFRGEAITDMILERLPVTAALAFLSVIFIVLIGFPLSLIGIRREGSRASRIVHTLTALNISFPGFFLGVLFIWIFGVILRFFAPGAYTGYQENPAAFAAYLVFPALAIAIPNAAILVKFLRASMEKELRSPYIRTARSKGCSPNGVLFRHVFKNAVIPSVTLLGMIVGEVFSGSIVIEQVFTIPGIGRLLIASINSRDYQLIAALVAYISFIVILANTAADIAIQIIDPRIRVR
ncbi:MAG: ABC transporter permease [Spirochaetaceae bacterium]|jgi:ABC-type dipeptide/oligopeptide/nickel transport system permease component|nr:ABC transporter permease [Spirochaetaceae bacterium]